MIIYMNTEVKMRLGFKFLAVLIFLGLSLTANAAIEGSWIGWAHWKYQGKGTKCSASLAFSETDKNFVFKKGFLDCDIIVMDIPEKIFSKINNKLFLDDVAVGKWSTDHFEWTERYNERTIINVSITVEGSHMDYIEHWIQDENTLLYDITGRLFREQPNR